MHDNDPEGEKPRRGVADIEKIMLYFCPGSTRITDSKCAQRLNASRKPETARYGVPFSLIPS